MLIMVTVGESETNFWFCWRNFQVWPNHGRKKVESHIEDRCSRFFTWRQEKLSDIVPDEHSLILILLCLDLGWNTHSGVYSRNILGVWISDETLHLMHVCYINSRCLDIRWNTPSWNFKFFSVFGYQIKHPFSCLLYYFSVFGYQIKKTLFVILLFRCLDIRWKHPFSCLLYYFSVFRYQMKHSFPCLLYYILVFGYQIKHPFSCLLYYFSVFGYQMKHSFSCLLYYILAFGYQIKHPFSCL